MKNIGRIPKCARYLKEESISEVETDSVSHFVLVYSSDSGGVSDSSSSEEFEWTDIDKAVEVTIA
jgi:hypothetical protein